MLSLLTHHLPIWSSGVPCALQDSWVLNLVPQSSLKVFADVCLAIIRTARVGPATALAPVGEMSVGLSRGNTGPGECLRHS